MPEISFQEVIKKAKNCAEKKDLHQFSKNIGIAGILISNDEEKKELYIAEIDGLKKNGRYKEALEVTVKAEEVIGDDKEFAFKILKKRGIILGLMGKYQEALNIFSEVKPSNNEEKIRKHINLMWIYLLMFEMEKDSLKMRKRYLNKAENSSEEILKLIDSCEIDSQLYKAFLSNLGCLYYNQGDFEKALKVFEEQKVKYAEENDYPIIFNNIASVLVQLNRIPEAEETLEKALELAEKHKNYYDIAENYSIRAKIALLNEDYSQSRDFYLVAYDYFIEANNVYKACMTYKKIQGIDFMVNNESLDLLSRVVK